MPDVNKQLLYTTLFGQEVPIGQHEKTDGTMTVTGEKNPLPISGEVRLSGSNLKQVTLLPANKTTTGIGTPETVGTNKTLRFEVWGTGTYTVQIQGIGNSGTARNLPVWDITNKTFVASNNITAAGFYEADIQGFVSVQANVSAISSGNVNAAGTVIA